MDANRGAVFRQLHQSGIFTMPCACDAISADLFEQAGFSAIGTTSVVTQAIGAPLRVGIGSGSGTLSLEDLAEVGGRRVSTGGAVPRAIYALVLSASREMLAGRFEFVSPAIPETEINEMLCRA